MKKLVLILVKIPKANFLYGYHLLDRNNWL